MREWFTAAELAEAALPGMPGTQRNVTAKASREGWTERAAADGTPLARKRRGRGGGWEYHVSLLPEAARAALALREGGQGADADGDRQEPGREEAWAAFERKPAGQREEAQRRLDALEAVERLVAQGSTRDRAIRTVAGQVGESRATLYRWRQRVKGVARADWLPHLAPAYTGRTATAPCDQAAWDQIVADYLRLEQPSFSACYERLERAAEQYGWQIPSRDALKRRIEAHFSAEAILLAREGREALKRRYPAQQRDRSVFHALQGVNADGHTFDVFVRWPDGTVARPVMAAWQDLYSGKILSWRIGQTENADLVRLSFGDMVAAYGIPEHAYLDNGRAFASKWLTGRMAFRHRFKVKAEEPAGILTQLGVETHWVTPYHGQAKPIERAFKDLCEYVAKHPKCAGAYTGNKPTAKPENYGSKAVPYADFLALVDEEIRRHNGRPNRRSHVCGGVKSFDQAFEDSYANVPVRRATLAQQRMWLLAAEGVKVRRDATVHLLGNYFFSDVTSRNIGRSVTVRFDPDDVTAGVHIYQQDGTYLGFAGCTSAAGFTDTAAAREHERARRAWHQAKKKELDAERRMTAAEASKALPDLPADQQGAPEPNVVKPAAFSTEQAKAPTASAPTPSPETEAERQAREQVARELEAPAEPTRIDTRQTRYRRARALEERLAAGEEIGAAERGWLERYRETPEYRAQRELEEEFGGALGHSA